MATRNIVPRAHEEGTVGTLVKRWLGGFFKWLNIGEYIDINTTSDPTHSEGRLFYDNDHKSLSFYNENINVTLNLGSETIVRVKNETGTDIQEGKVVYINGFNGAHAPTVALAKADIVATSHALGLSTSLIPNNGYGYVCSFGHVHDVDTGSWNEGDTLYLSGTTAGELTTTAPSISTIVATVMEAGVTGGSVHVVVTEQGVIGADMLKSVYDPDVDGVVDRASSICLFARKESTGSISKGTPVYLVDAHEGYISVEGADASSLSTMPAIGIAFEDLEYDVTKKIIVFGELENIDTSSWSVGDALYVSETTGQLTNVKPQGNNYIQKVAQVITVHATTGSIEIFGAGRTNDVPNYFPYTEKVTLVDDDLLLLSDSEDSYNKKKIKRSSLEQDASQVDYILPTGSSIGADNVQDAIDELESLIETPTKNKFFPIDYNSNIGNFRTRSIASAGSFNFNFVVPDDFSSITKLIVCGIISSGAVGAGKDIDLSSNYGAIGETYNNHAESDTTSVYDLSMYSANDIIEIDISGVFTNLNAGDYCGINIDHNSIGGAIYYLGICFKYD